MARALEPSTVFAIPFDPVVRVFRSDPALLWGVTRLLATRLRVMDEALADSVFLDVTGRTAKRLLELSEGSDEFLLPITQEVGPLRAAACSQIVDGSAAADRAQVRHGG